jgi:hypothetical protein
MTCESGPTDFYFFSAGSRPADPSSPKSACQRFSPRHCLAEAHHCMQLGAVSRTTTALHLGQVTRCSSENISTSWPHWGHWCILAVSIRLSCPGHLSIGIFFILLSSDGVKIYASSSSRPRSLYRQFDKRFFIAEKRKKKRSACQENIQK